MRIASALRPVRRFFSGSVQRRALGMLGWTAVGLYFAFAALLLALRYAVLPNIDDYRGDIEAAAARALTRPVAIGAIDAGWSGLRPRLTIRGFEIRDAAGRPALGFDHVEAELSWASLWHFDLVLHRLEIVAPDLDIRRDVAGRLFVAGLELVADGGAGRFDDWLLAQERVVVRDAVVRWHDELRAAPVLALAHLNFDLQNSGNRHRFGFTAEPPRELAARLDLRGDFRGDDLDLLEAWKGEVYGELDYADLAVWRQWVDYPVDLPRGSGGLRLWLSFLRQQPVGVTADVRLADVDVRLAPELPLLELGHLEGRLSAKRLADGYEVRTRGLALATRDGIRVEPMDFQLRYQAAAANRPAAGELQTRGLDLGALAALSAHLPLAEAERRQLAAYAPRGRLHNFTLAWRGEAGALQGWRSQGEFAELGLSAHAGLPGFSGLSGQVDGDERGGRLTLDSHRAVLELPTIFDEPRLPLEALTAQADWKATADGIEVELAKAVFHNRDAAGEVAGRYRRGAAGGRGVIDLTGKLTRAAGGAVWRYMPLVVNQDVRDWLKVSIGGGHSDETTVRLKGDLDRFPFRDGNGIFQVKGGFAGATLRYAPGWPEIRDVAGELLFDGVRMLIAGTKGSIMGVGIGPVTAVIADLEAPEELLTVEGRAAGATADFLRFIEASPVGERIDHFTADMTAAGDGELQLRLDLPLRRLDDTVVAGRYRFVRNRLLPEPGMPPLTDVNGELRFTADRLDAQKIRAAMFGMPMTVDIATVGDGSVNVKAAGSASARGLRQQFGPLFDNLAGTATWNGTVRVRKKTAELRIESNLQGMASSLPEPFNKTTNQALPLLVERKQAPGGRDVTSVTLGEAVKATLVRRHDDGKAVVERGAIAVGAPLRLPERGVLLAVHARRLDLDLWRKLFAGGGNGATAAATDKAALPIGQIELRADETALFGRSIAGLRLNAHLAGSQWKAELKSREASGFLEWDGRGAGRLGGHLAQLTIPETPPGKAASAAAEPADELPAVDLIVDRFALPGKELGGLKLKAETARDGYWNANFELRNDDATLNGSGRWRAAAAAPDTRLEFKLAARSIERLLDRLGYPDAVRRGTANAEGALSWSGPPTAIDYPTLAGEVKFEAANGQFNKLEPGVGRLLGVLSLQSLPRRLTLDFRDVFSQGFAFDAIAGEAAIAGGVMETRNLKIAGPAAGVLMSGSVDLGRETQNLRVRVAPALGESIATGVLLANPATGAAAWVFNKLFGNPFDQAFAFEYAVTGSWADPKVEKIGGPAKDADKAPADEGRAR